MTETQYILQLTLVGLVSGAVFWVVASWAEKRKLQPSIDEEKKLRLQLEVKRQEEGQKAEEQQEVLKTQLAAAATRCTSLDAALNAEIDAAFALQERLLQAQQLQRDSDSQMTMLRSRQADLEGALDAKQELAQRLAQELNSTRISLADERNVAAQREGALRASLSECERQAANGMSASEIVQAELESARAALATLEQDTEMKQADLKRKLTATGQKAQMLQREIMALVSTGNPGEPAAVVTASEDIAKAQEHAVAAEKRVAELEAQLALGDVGTRKRLREAEQRICELEFRLAQVDEAPAPAPVAPVVTPAVQPIIAPLVAPAAQPLVALTEADSAPPTEASVQPTSGL